MQGGLFRHQQPKGLATAMPRPKHHRATPRLYKHVGRRVRARGLQNFLGKWAKFVEAVWGDGQQAGREIVSATDQPPFGSRRFRIPFDAAGKKWDRFSVWDSAGNGAFTQPVHLRWEGSATVSVALL